MRRCWSIIGVVVFGLIASCVLIAGCGGERRETVHRVDERPRREVYVEHDRRPREREVEVRHEDSHHEEHGDHH